MAVHLCVTPAARSRPLRIRSRALRAAFTAVLLAGAPAGALAAQGFGGATAGGSNGPVVHVTNLNDSGPGSLREAVAQGNRTVAFAVAGTINLASDLSINGAFVTIDGSSAPAPGITLRNHGLVIRGSRGAHDVIVRGIRIRGAAIDGVQIAYSAYNIVLEHVSVHGSGDGNLDITESAHDVTVAWSIFQAPAAQKNSLIKYRPSRITLHHNLFGDASERNPQVRIDDAGTPATATTVDMRNNVVWDWAGGYGTQVRYGPRANVVANYFHDPSGSASARQRALIVCRGDGVETAATLFYCDSPASRALAYTFANVSGDGVNVDAAGTVSQAFPAPPVETQDACTAARDVLANAGVRPLDAVDQPLVSSVSLTGCPAVTTPLVVRFTNPTAGSVVSGSVVIGLAASGGADYTYSLAVDGTRFYAGSAASTTWNTATVPNGAHTLTGTVTDGAGRAATAQIVVTVSNATTAPLSVAITSPPNGATISGNVSVAMAVSGAVTLPVTFTLKIDGSTVIAVRTVWSTTTSALFNTRLVRNGSHTLSVTVVDAGGRAASASKSVTVANNGRWAR